MKYKKPTTNTRHLQPKTHALIALTSLVVLSIATTMASRQTFNGWEYTLFRAIYDLPAGLLLLFWLITQLGSAWMILILALAAVVGHVRGLAHKVIINGAITYVAVEYLKTLVARPRPAVFYSWVHPRELFDIGNGFPSGHTAIATVLALTVMPYLPKRYYYLLPLWIIGVGLSRIYLGVHAPLDIIGGVALGFVISGLQHVWTARKIQRRA